MTEEQLQIIKGEAELVARLLVPFGEKVHELSSSIRSAFEFLICVSFVNGARFGFRLAETEKQFVHDGEYKVGGTINDKV